MTSIRYNAPTQNRRRVLRPSDLARFGLTFDKDLVWEKANRWTLDLDAEACETLVSKLPKEFTILETSSPSMPEPEPVDAGNSTDDESVDELSADSPDESPDDSESEVDAMADESPRVKRPRR